jgi:PAS domain S-box-containing protein
MKLNLSDLIDFGKVNALLEGFNKSTGFVTAILDLEGKVLSKSGWRQMCTEFHRVNPATSKKCTISDTVLAGKLAEGEKYHFYKCLNGLVDIAVPVVIRGEHIANLFSGQFFFEEPDRKFFKKQAEKYGFDEKKYLEALEQVPVVSKEKVLVAMDFLLNMTQLISEMTLQKLELTELNATISESEERFKSVFESANVGKSITLPTGEINVNETFCNMLGYTRDELQNLKWQDITPKEEVPIIQKYLDSLLKGEKNSTRFEKRYVCKNGTYLWADVSVALRLNDTGKPLYFITTIIDITGRKILEEEQRLSAELFKNAFHVGPAGMTVTRIADGKFIDANESFCKLFGFDRDEVIGHTSTDLNLWTLEERKRLIEKQISSGGLHNFELLARSKSGRLINILFSSKQMKLKGEDCHITTMIDITERKRVEEALSESEERFRKIFEGGPIGMVMANLNTRKIFRANKAFCDMLDYTEDELLQLDFIKITFAGDRERDMAAVINLYEGRIQKYNTEKRYLKKNGSIIWAALALTKIYSEKDQSFYALAMIEDITSKKMAEEKIQKLNTELEKKVEQRTAQFKAVNKELETFTYSVSHDLKAPIRGIDGYSKLLLDLYKPVLNEEAQGFIRTIRSSTIQMNQLIDDLLNYSRLERSQLSIEFIKIYDLINSLVSIYKADLEVGKFKVIINSSDMGVFADPKGLSIAIRNLLENAIKFTRGKADPLIQIEVEEKTMSWIISVRDNGIGFDMKYHDKIFEIFQRLQRVEDYPGTGIGLAMVNKAMHRMNGRAWADSLQGTGSTFYLEIPKNKKYAF